MSSRSTCPHEMAVYSALPFRRLGCGLLESCAAHRGAEGRSKWHHQRGDWSDQTCRNMFCPLEKQSQDNLQIIMMMNHKYIGVKQKLACEH